MATGNNVFTELATNTCQRNGPIVFGAMLVSLLKYRPNIGQRFCFCLDTVQGFSAKRKGREFSRAG